jgi:hypothetical protein
MNVLFLSVESRMATSSNRPKHSEDLPLKSPPVDLAQPKFGERPLGRIRSEEVIIAGHVVQIPPAVPQVLAGCYRLSSLAGSGKAALGWAR